jgi:hypothetical protein
MRSLVRLRIRYLRVCKEKSSISPKRDNMDLFRYVTKIHVKSLNMEKVGVISDSYQPNADKPILYPIEIPKYTDVTVKLK